MKGSKKRIAYTIAIAIIVVFSTTYAILMTLEKMDYKNYLQGEYSKNMYQLIDAVNGIKVDLTKSAVVGSKEQSILVFGDIFRNSNIANDKIHSLPVPQEAIAGTSKFLSQVGDFSYSLAKVSSEGKVLTENDYENIDQLKNEADYLLIQLNEVQSNVNKGDVKWEDVRKKASNLFQKSSENLIKDKFKGIQKQVVQYPSLIYDGPFSDNILNITPKINSKKTISEKEAVKLIKNIFKEDKIVSISKQGEYKRKDIPVYSFILTLKEREKGEEVNVDISKNGGKIVYLLDNKNIGKSKKNEKEALYIGSEFLKNLGYKNMKSTYTLKSNNTILVSYVYKKDNINIYPDQLKLKIALDDGSIVGVEAEKYLVAHEDNRKIEKPKISKEEARKRVGKNLKIISENLAIIPTENNKEVLCYEFSGKYKDDNFVVYINAETGAEQKILQIIDTEGGKLTI